MDPTPTTPTEPKQYEFTPEQDRVIGQLGRDMAWVAAPMVVIGALYIATALIHAVRAFSEPRDWVAVFFIGLAGLLILALGTWTSAAGIAFRRVAETTGRDISHLMAALTSLGRSFSVQSAIVKVYVIFVAIGLIAALISLFVHRT
jgi:hypothetical protein